MRTKNFLITLCSVVSFSLVIIIFGQNRPDTIQNIVTTTHQQIRYFKDNLRDAETKKLVADGKFLDQLGFNDQPRLYPNDVWRNTSLPVVVTYVFEGQHSQAIGLINNAARTIPNNTILVYNLGLGDYTLKLLLNYCNNSRCQVINFDLSDFPSHVQEVTFRAYRPLIIQDALMRTGAIFFIENNYRFIRNITHSHIYDLFEKTAKNAGIATWPVKSKIPVSSLTHKKMFEYFHTDDENFLFVQMVEADVLLIVNTKTIHQDVMLPWNQCALTQDCLIPIGAQSGGCKFDKKPQYRYSGCHDYDTSALNIVLGLKFNMDSSKYSCDLELFETVSLAKAVTLLREFEMNFTTEGRYLADN